MSYTHKCSVTFTREEMANALEKGILPIDYAVKLFKKKYGLIFTRDHISKSGLFVFGITIDRSEYWVTYKGV